jgi:hypothetical protein
VTDRGPGGATEVTAREYEIELTHEFESTQGRIKVSMIYQPSRSPRPPGIRLRIFDAKREKAYCASPTLSCLGAINENYNVLKSSGVFGCGIKKKGRQGLLFISLSDRFLIVPTDLVWSTYPSIAQSMLSANKSSVGSQISRSRCHILTNGRPGELIVISLKLYPSISFPLFEKSKFSRNRGTNCGVSGNVPRSTVCGRKYRMAYVFIHPFRPVYLP